MLKKSVRLFNDLFNTLENYYYLEKVNNIERINFGSDFISRSLYPNVQNYKLKVGGVLFVCSVMDSCYYIERDGEEVSRFTFNRIIKKVKKKVDYRFNYVPVLS